MNAIAHVFHPNGIWVFPFGGWSGGREMTIFAKDNWNEQQPISPSSQVPVVF